MRCSTGRCFISRRRIPSIWTLLTRTERLDCLDEGQHILFDATREAAQRLHCWRGQSRSYVRFFTEGKRGYLHFFACVELMLMRLAAVGKQSDRIARYQNGLSSYSRTCPTSAFGYLKYPIGQRRQQIFIEGTSKQHQVRYKHKPPR